MNRYKAWRRRCLEKRGSTCRICGSKYWPPQYLDFGVCGEPCRTERFMEIAREERDLKQRAEQRRAEMMARAVVKLLAQAETWKATP